MNSYGVAATRMNGSERRNLKRSMVPSAFTRAQALRLLDSETDLDKLMVFKDHTNKHVKRRVEQRVEFLKSPPMVPTALLQIQEQVNSTDETLLNLSIQYEESLVDVKRIFEEKGSDIAALKRSLVSRKSARSRKNKVA